MTLFLAVEGKTDAPVARALARDAGLAVGQVYEVGGSSGIDRGLARYAAIGARQPILVLRDLDQDSACAPSWLRDRPTARWLCVRLAVRETEAWLLGDRERFAAFFKVPPTKIPAAPEALPDPKRALVDVVRHSRSDSLRRAVVPRDGGGAPVGPGYVATIIDYVTTSWRLEVASRQCDSLRRARLALAGLARRWRDATAS